MITMLSDIIEDSVMIRVLDWLLEMPNIEFSKSDVAKQIKSTFPSVKPVFDTLEKLEIIKKTKTVGRTQLYVLNEDSKLFMILSRFNLILASKFIDLEQAHNAKKAKKIAMPMAASA